ncbi:MAG TPA: hypothetical protein VJ577_01310 [Burkholderiaceae bacterium]|nr:hypothetical protein [Burkholderiaceae bacterium]
MQNTPSRREIPIYLDHATPIGKAYMIGAYITGRETDDFIVVEDLVYENRHMLTPGRGLKRRFKSWWYPHTRKWREMTAKLDTLLLQRIGTTEVIVEAERKLDSREIFRAKVEFLTEILKRARYRTWRI